MEMTINQEKYEKIMRKGSIIALKMLKEQLEDYDKELISLSELKDYVTRITELLEEQNNE